MYEHTKILMSAHKIFMSAHKTFMSTHTLSSHAKFFLTQTQNVHFYDRIQLLHCLKKFFFFAMSAHKK